jgi:hypothetical protein
MQLKKALTPVHPRLTDMLLIYDKVFSKNLKNVVNNDGYKSYLSFFKAHLLPSIKSTSTGHIVKTLSYLKFVKSK